MEREQGRVLTPFETQEEVRKREYEEYERKRKLKLKEKEDLLAEEEKKKDILDHKREKFMSTIITTSIIAAGIFALTYLVCVGGLIHREITTHGLIPKEGDVMAGLYLYPITIILFEAILMGIVIGLEVVIGCLLIKKAENNYWRIKNIIKEKGYNERLW